MFCDQCGGNVRDTAKFCPNCGADLRSMIVVREIPPEDLAGTASPSAAPSIPPPQAQAPSFPAPRAQAPSIPTPRAQAPSIPLSRAQALSVPPPQTLSVPTPRAQAPASRPTMAAISSEPIRAAQKGPDFSAASMNPEADEPVAKPMTQRTAADIIAQRSFESKLCSAILVTIFCCWPFGIPAIVCAARANGAHDRKEYALASSLNNQAGTWITVSFICGIIYTILVICLMAMD